MTRTVYSPDTWSIQAFHRDPRRPALLAWLKANGIDPDDLPVEQHVTIHDTDHGEEIRYVAYVRSDQGGKRAADNGLPVFEARATPCTVAPPPELDTDNEEQP